MSRSARHRLFLDEPLAQGRELELGREQANYLGNVLRLGPGDEVLLFNGRDGEWRAAVAVADRKRVTLRCEERTRPQDPPADLHYLFAPLKHARLDYMAQKAVEMGASRLHPVLTRRTQVARVNLERLRANAIEAAEQCGLLALPEIRSEDRLETALAELAPERLLVFCDEEAQPGSPLDALREAGPGPLAVLIGPEGGFDAQERTRILSHPRVLRISLGPRILRADTAAVAALALVQSVLGDWPR